MAQVRLTPQAMRTWARIVSRADRYRHDDPAMQAALFQIGNLVKNEAQKNIRDAGAVDTGFLRGSVQFRIEKANGLSQVAVGPFGTVYGRMVEFGGAMTDRQRRAMFKKFRLMGKPPRPGKGIIAGSKYRARPYLGPALASQRNAALQILRALGTKPV